MLLVVVASCTLLPECDAPGWLHAQRCLRSWVADPHTAELELSPHALTTALNMADSATRRCPLGEAALRFWNFALLVDSEKQYRWLAMSAVWDDVRGMRWEDVARSGWRVFNLTSGLCQIQVDRRSLQPCQVVVGEEPYFFDADTIFVLLQQACGHASLAEMCNGEQSPLSVLAAIEGRLDPIDPDVWPEGPPPVLATSSWDRDALLAAFATSLPILMPSLDLKLPQLPDSICPSEAGFFLAWVALLGVDAVVESGRGSGGSTAFWCRSPTWARLVIFSIDRAHRKTSADAVAGCAQVSLIEADAFQALRPLLNSLSDKRVGLFVDGPKGRVAVKLALELMAEFPSIVLVGLHDVHRLSPYYQSKGMHKTRAALEEAGCLTFFSDEDWFVKSWATLDRDWDLGDAGSLGSYSQTVGVCLRPSVLLR
mmetsp:Transcript_59850/g.135040  ORF Transcript_59850/g.135040 Transcript_59850/m.135040 type:complete len:426 (+) Transcript_59850:85-1362(+)